MKIPGRLIEQPPWFFRVLFPGALFRKKGVGKKVYLTFDDGPIPVVTSEVLDILEREGVKGTFFMVGDNVRKYPHVALQVRAAGHAVGSHTFHHLQGIRSSVKDYLEDVRLGMNVVGMSRLFRPPHGLLKPGQTLGLRRLGLKTVMFDVVSRDYEEGLRGEDVSRIVLSRVRDGSVIVFHDSVKSIARLREALPVIIRELRQRGYEFDTLEEV